MPKGKKRPSTRKRHRNAPKGRSLAKVALVVGGVALGAKLLHDHQQKTQTAQTGQAAADLTVHPAGVSSTGASGGKR